MRLCDGDAVEGLSVHLGLSLASDAAATTGVFFDDAEFLELLDRVADDAAAGLGCAGRLHAPALSSPVSFSERSDARSSLQVDLSRDRRDADKVPVGVYRRELSCRRRLHRVDP